MCFELKTLCHHHWELKVKQKNDTSFNEQSPQKVFLSPFVPLSYVIFSFETSITFLSRLSSFHLTAATCI